MTLLGILSFQPNKKSYKEFTSGIWTIKYYVTDFYIIIIYAKKTEKLVSHWNKTGTDKNGMH